MRMRTDVHSGLHLAFALCVASAANVRDLSAQSTLSGVVFDSLLMRPLEGATVHARGRMAVTDARGAFRVDSVAQGTITIEIEHPRLDSIGMYALDARVQHDGITTHQIGTPSFVTLARGLCGRDVGVDSAIVFGELLDTEKRPAALASLAFAWTVVGKTNIGGLGQQRMTFRTGSDSSGRFVACGLPLDEPYVAEAINNRGDSTSRISVALPARTSRILRQNLMLASAGAGVVFGRIRDSTGSPVVGARISVGEQEALSDGAGRFSLLGAPTGTQNIEITAIGSVPVSRTVNVSAVDTANVVVDLVRAVTLATVRTEATVVAELVRAHEERKRTGLGRYRDSLELAKLPVMASAFDGIPSLSVVRGRGAGFRLEIKVPVQLGVSASKCEPRIFIDGRSEEVEELNTIQPKDVAWVEVYTRSSVIPSEFMEGIQRRACGVVAIVTKRRIAR